MDFDAIVSAISNLGFPIFACIMMYRQNLKTLEKFEDLTKVVQSNTSTTKALMGKLDIYFNKER